jgi:hypothetical protein
MRAQDTFRVTGSIAFPEKLVEGDDQVGDSGRASVPVSG